MKVLVDTTVWSAAFRHRRGKEHGVVGELARLIGDYRATLIGPIRQEVLSGIADRGEWISLQVRLTAFPDESLVTEDFEQAAAAFNACRAKGIQGSNTDFLICAIAIRQALPIFTLDRDFTHFSRVLPIRLHRPGT